MAELSLSLVILLIFFSLLVFLYLIARPRPVKVPIKNRHVFITGGSCGIGLALAHRAASEGARVSIMARSTKKLEDAKQAIRLSTGVDVAVHVADVRDYDAVSRVMEEVGPIDVLVVNHGVYLGCELDGQDMEDIRSTVDVNLTGSLHVIKAALPSMKSGARKGPASLALMSSQAGQVGVYGYAAYSATKFGLRGLAEALQQELIAHNIHISLIFPPPTHTPTLAQEMKRRPRVTNILAAWSTALTAEQVAEKTIRGIKNGEFMISCNFEGWFMNIMTAGLSPQRSFLLAFVEIVAMSFMRFVALCVLWNFYRIVHKHSTVKKQ